MHNLRHAYPPQNRPWRPNPRYRAPFPERNPLLNNRARWAQPQFTNKEEHWCETCDRGFPSLELLETHKQQHQKCNIDGCQFVAHPKVITKHIQMQHSSGLYKRIAKLVNPEEIKKWREERKKKYPTKENIDKKIAEMKEKVKRGEKMGLGRERRSKYIKTETGVKRQFNESYENRQTQQPNLRKSNPTPVNKKPRREPKVAPLFEEKARLTPFGGIQHLVMDIETEDKDDKLNCNFLIEDDDSEQTLNKVIEIVDKPILCGALSSLLCDYKSSDDEEYQTTSVKTSHHNMTDTVKSNATQNINSVEVLLDQKNNESDNDSGPEEMKVIKNEIQNTDVLNMVPIAEKGKRDKQTMFKKRHVQINHQQNIRKRSKLPSTLLQKLLSKEVQHERNIVLQCIRYVMKNNYFQK